MTDLIVASPNLIARYGLSYLANHFYADNRTLDRQATLAKLVDLLTNEEISAQETAILLTFSAPDQQLDAEAISAEVRKRQRSINALAANSAAMTSAIQDDIKSSKKMLSIMETWTEGHTLSRDNPVRQWHQALELIEKWSSALYADLTPILKMLVKRGWLERVNKDGKWVFCLTPQVASCLVADIW